MLVCDSVVLQGDALETKRGMGGFVTLNLVLCTQSAPSHCVRNVLSSHIAVFVRSNW